MILSPIWLPASLAAGGLQAWRTAVQRRVSQSMSVNAAGLVRFLFGLPVVLLLLAAYQLVLASGPLPGLSSFFLLLCAAGGLGQILGTNLLLMSFEHRNFVVGTAYSKTEAVQSALLSLVLLGERLSWLAWLGIGAGVTGIMILSAGGKRSGPADLIRALGQPAARYGIASGSMFALTGVATRRATIEVATPDHIQTALVALAVTLVLQIIMQGGYIFWRERPQFARIFANRRSAGQVGLLSGLGSACWFTGFTTAPVALVRIVGQVEVAFTMAFAHFYLGERMMRSEVFGLLLVTAGVVMALAGATL